MNELVKAMTALQASVAANIRTDEKLLHLIELVGKRMELLERRVGYLEARLTITQNFVDQKLEAKEN